MQLPKMPLVAAALMLSAGPMIAAPQQYELPEETAEFLPGPGVDVAEANCASCHSTDYLRTQPPGKGHDFWDAEVHKMINTYGAPITEEDAAKITDYLAQTY